MDQYRHHDKWHQFALLATKYGAKNIRLLRSKDTEVNVVVHMQPGRTFLDLIGLWQSLEDLLGVKIEIVDDAGSSVPL